MAKNLKVNMQFTADSSQAKRQIQDLQLSLNGLMRTTNINMNSDDIRTAIGLTSELQVHLNRAINTNTGNLDFSKLSQSIKASGKSINEYADSLLKLGPQGQQTFMKLAQAITESEIPLRRTNKLVSEFATTLANTARWQLSSSILHGFMGAIQSAYGYAQDLNESLNNIRIVTGQNIDEMAKFAATANKAAKALSATTTEYTNASLIYYQQGLSEADVKKRADVTIKLANVSRQSAEEVSNQMTSIWNNFYDGSKSLEHYADVLTALGAATASSTQEISGGLEKFAAVADTIGLSYEYAAAALATITSNTRESEEVVGTALKTIFARIQGLNLGETLDDGTTLNKYSEALNKVGINILDASGNLKTMDTILNEMGNKWDNISKAQQVALAQTVAGTRQYNQLIALMDNWDSGDSDSFKATLDIAKNASGALQEQADIYGESWEAASKRVKAAAESIYDSLINDEFFIDLLNHIEKILTFVDRLIEGMGGLQGVLMTLGTVLTKVFSQQLATGLTKTVENIKLNTKKGHQAMVDERADSIKNMANIMAKMSSEGEGDPAFGAIADAHERQLNAQVKLIDNQERMNELEIMHTKQLMDQAKLRDEAAIEATKTLEQKKAELAAAGDDIRTTYAQHARDKHDGYSGEFVSMEQAKIRRGALASRDLQSALFNGTEKPTAEAILQIFKSINDEANGIKIFNSGDRMNLTQWLEDWKKLDQSSDEYTHTVDQLVWKMDNLNKRISEHAHDVLGVSAEQVEAYAKSTVAVTEAKEKETHASEEAVKANNMVEESIDNAKGAQKDWADDFVSLTNAAMSTVSAISMLGGLADTLQSPDMSGWEKLTTVLTTMTMLIPTLIQMYESWNKVLDSNTMQTLKNIKSKIEQYVQDQKTFKGQKKQNYIKNVISQYEHADSEGAGLSILTKERQTQYRKQARNELEQSHKWDKNKRKFIDTDGKEYSLREFKSLQDANAAKLASSDTNAISYLSNLSENDQKKYRQQAKAKLKQKYTWDIEKQKFIGPEGKEYSSKEFYELQDIDAGKLAFAENDYKHRSIGSVKTKWNYLSAEDQSGYRDKAAQSLQENFSFDNDKKQYINKQNGQSYSANAFEQLKDNKAQELYKGDLKKANAEKIKGLKTNATNAVKAVAPYALIAAGVAIAAGAVAYAKAQFEKYSQAAIDAAKTAESAASAYSAAAEAYEKFKSGMSDYKEAKDGLQGLVKGTLEYKEALLAANNAAYSLIETNNLIAGKDYTIDKDGVIQISDEAQQEILNQKMEAMQKAQDAKLIAAQNAKEAQTKSDMIDLARGDIKSSSGDGAAFGNIMAAMGSGAASGAAIGAGVGALAGAGVGAGPGAIAGAIIGAVGGLVTGIVAQSNSGAASGKEQAAIEKIADNYDTLSTKTNEEFKTYLSETLEIDDQKLIDSLLANRDEVMKLAAEMHKNTEASTALNKQIVASAVADNANVQNSKYKDEIIATTAKFTDDDAAAARKQFEDDGFGTKGISWASGKNDKEAKDAFEQYMAAAGIEGATLADVKGTDKNRKFVYTDKDGNEQEVTLETMLDVMAMDQAKQQANTRATEIRDIYQKVGESQGKAGVATLSAAVNQDYSKLSVSQMKAGAEDTLTASELGITSDTQAKALGYDTIEKLNAALAASATEAKNTWERMLDTHTSSTRTAIENISSVGDISFDTIQRYGSMLENLDQSKVEDFNEGLQTIIANNEEHADTILNIAAGIDWSQGQGAVDELNGQLYDMGINIEEGSAEWKKLQDAINSMSFSVVNQNLDTVRDKLKTINDIAKNIKIGDIISDEEYEKLTSVNGALKQDFVMTADGYMYTGTQNLQDIASQATESQLKKAKDNNAKAKKAYDAIQDGEFATIDWQKVTDSTASNADIANAANIFAKDSNVLAALGKDQSQVQNWQKIMANAEAVGEDGQRLYSDDQVAAAKEQLQSLFNDATKLTANYEAGLYSDRKAEELAASTMSMNELKDAYNEGEGYISKEVYDKFKAVYDAKLKEVEFEEAERYKAVNQELETMESRLSTINKLKENATGQERINLIEQETEAIKEQAEAQSRYIDEIQQNLSKDKTTIDNYGFIKDGKEIKVEYDKNGAITNYAEIEAHQRELYNQAKQDLALGNIDQATFDEKEKAWNQFNEDTAQYQETLSTYAEAQNTLIDINNQFYDSMVSAYTETLNEASEELSKYTVQMEHHNKILEHYKSLSSLMGKETDYDSMDVILKGQAKLADNNLSISKKTSQMYKEEAERAKRLMDTAPQGSDAFDAYKKQWEEASAKARESEDQMLADLQTWAESEKAVLENTLTDLSSTLEERLTGGLSFDKLATQMERAQSLQEDYLTTTNQIYETTKMMRTAQQAIDASSNAVAKEKLKGFINETKSMQEQGKLSQYELDMQQAKYDLLVAEIALEEAQNTKSTVRLQRDSEGNFGYVYTADSSAVSDAQQKFDDAQNALYNKGLEGANDYTQKYQQTMAEMQDSLTQIQSDYLAGSFVSEEEYQNAVAESKAYYFEKLRGYADLYNTALSADSSIAAEAWSTNFSTMFQSTEELESAVSNYMTGAEAAFERWSEVVATVEETTGADLDSLTTKVGNVTSASDELTQALLGENGEGGLISEIKSGFEEVADTIKTALESWTGVTITMNEDGTVTVTENSANAEGAATGGLTSDWGPQGKMLMVHENELILNADQTNKFFDNLALMESILATIDTYALGQQLGGSLMSPGYTSSSTNTLEQSVHIEASFPGVTDRNEIEEAFNNLVNKASQYANRK